MCHGNCEDETNIEDYSIAPIEPLHDCKNVINRVIGDLVNVADDATLKSIIANRLAVLQG